MDFKIEDDVKEEFILPDLDSDSDTSLPDECAPKLNEASATRRIDESKEFHSLNNNFNNTIVTVPIPLMPNKQSNECSQSFNCFPSQTNKRYRDVKLFCNNDTIQSDAAEGTSRTTTKLLNTNISENTIPTKDITTVNRPRRCLAPNCTVTEDKNGIQLYNIPLDEYLQDKWIKSLHQAHEKLGLLFLIDPLIERLAVCSRHFSEKDFYPDDKNQGAKKDRILMETAVPSVYEDNRKIQLHDVKSENWETSMFIKTEMNEENLKDVESNTIRVEKLISSSSSVRHQIKEPVTNKKTHDRMPVINVVTKVYLRPPLNYVCLIILALKNRVGRGMHLKDIYQWISDHFPFFKTTDINWWSSIDCQVYKHRKNKHRFFKKIQITSQTHKQFYTIDKKKKDRVEQFMEKYCYKNITRLRESMLNPEHLELMLKGELNQLKTKNVINVSGHPAFEVKSEEF